MRQSLKSTNKREGLYNPNLAFLTSGLLLLGSANVFAAETLPIHDSHEVASVTQKNKTITVTVRDANGELIGANVIVKGTTNGNVTDMDGRVILQDVPANAILEVSYIGYQPQDVPVKNQTISKLFCLKIPNPWRKWLL